MDGEEEDGENAERRVRRFEVRRGDGGKSGQIKERRK
jgi:hypothetical protein